MNIQIFQLPYDSGRREERMGRGPVHLVDQGLPNHLRRLGHTVDVSRLELGREPAVPGMETRATFDLYAALAEQTAVALARGQFPLVLSGNCGAGIGTLSGLAAGGHAPGIVWMDAHGDFNTPDTSASGFLDGMGLAVAAGLCWQRLAASVPGYRPVPPSAILHLGGRDLDPPESDLMARRGVRVLTAGQVSAGEVAQAMVHLRGSASEIYLHLDLDVLDPSEAPANHFPAPPGGLRVEEVSAAIRVARRNVSILAMGVASYDPAFDREGKTLAAAFRLVADALPGGLN